MIRYELEPKRLAPAVDVLQSKAGPWIHVTSVRNALADLLDSVNSVGVRRETVAEAIEILLEDLE